MALVSLMIRWGADTSSDRLRQCARCTKCGHKRATLRHRGRAGTHIGFEPFPVPVDPRRSPEVLAHDIRSAISPRPVRRGVGSSAGARELLTRLDTGQRCSTSFAAGLSNAGPPSLSQDAKSLDSRTTGMRSCTSATKSFGSVISIVQDFSTSPVALSFHSSHSPAKVIGSPSARVKYQAVCRSRYSATRSIPMQG